MRERKSIIRGVEAQKKRGEEVGIEERESRWWKR